MVPKLLPNSIVTIVMFFAHQTMCHIELRQGGWGPEPMIQKSCKTVSACGDNYVQVLNTYVEICL